MFSIHVFDSCVSIHVFELVFRLFSRLIYRLMFRLTFIHQTVVALLSEPACRIGEVNVAPRLGSSVSLVSQRSEVLCPCLVLRIGEVNVAPVHNPVPQCSTHYSALSYTIPMRCQCPPRCWLLSALTVVIVG